MPSPPNVDLRRRMCTWFTGAAAAWFVASLPSPAAALPEVTVGSDHILRVEDEPFFPIGLLQLGNDDYADWNDRIRQSGANAVWDIGYAFADSTPSCAAVRDSAEATGYKLLIGSFDTWEWDLQNTPEAEIAVPMYPADSLETLLDCFDESDAIIALANRDEPVWALSQGNLGNIDSTHIFDTYAQLQQEASDLPVFMNLAPVHQSADSATWVNDLLEYRDASDIVMWSSYPYPAGPGTCSPKVILGQPDCSMDRLPDGIDLFRANVARADQPIFANIQAHKGIPTKEARWEAYVSIIHGATGVLWAGHNWTHPGGGGAANWSVIAPVIAEVASLHDVYVAADLAGFTSGSPDLDVIGRRGESPNVAYAFAASRRGASGTMTVNVNGISQNIAWAEVLFENRWVPVVNRKIHDHFADYEAHVYRMDAASVPQPTSAEISEALSTDRFDARVMSNPVRDTARVWFTAAETATVEFAVYDITGRLIAEPQAVRSGKNGWLTWDGRDR
ncbi:MAG: hypothetical protein HKN12_06105, partial [Gemmatimonadetes bacterium]|nr:hypothetical protein [Gemmatimonadota bacterium]